MGIRLTGISTPVGGVTWEFKDQHNENQISKNKLDLTPDRKIEVFISSICGDPKYDDMRKKLKDMIESTQLARVYTFEGEGASTLSAEEHYIHALETCDICIFLIDNFDGVPQGVQKEIDVAKKLNKKTLYYFCDERCNSKTAQEQCITGAKYAKSKTVHNFDELSSNGAKDLLNDIINIYRYYCADTINNVLNNQNVIEQKMEFANIEKIQLPVIPKIFLSRVDKCKEYILKFSSGRKLYKSDSQSSKTSELDEWCFQFLPIMFEGKSIKHFNTGMFLDFLKNNQDKNFFQVVSIRWSAIEAYYLGDIDTCLHKLEKALKIAKESNQPTWVIKDILIDLRNQNILVANMKGSLELNSSAQKELSESQEQIYYPILDRIRDNIHEKYIKGIFKKKIQSPYSVTFRNDLNEHAELLASLIALSLFNASLSHMLLFYEEMRNFMFYLSSQYSDWTFRHNLLKLEILLGKEKEVKGVIDSYPEILNNMNSADANDVMNFCNNQPIYYKRFSSQLIALNVVGYYLDDEKFDYNLSQILKEIEKWSTEESASVPIGTLIFKCFSGIAIRVPQDAIMNICCLFMEKHYCKYYIELFRFMEEHIDINKAGKDLTDRFLSDLIKLLDDREEREQIKYAPYVLCSLRKQNRILTQKLDEKIKAVMPDFYNGDYKLETTENETEDMPLFIYNYVQAAKKYNISQGKNGIFFKSLCSNYETIRNILVNNDIQYETVLLNEVILVVLDTLLVSHAEINIKLDAISLLICIAVKFPEVFNKNKSIYQQLLQSEESISSNERSILFSNIESVSLKIALQFLYNCMGIDTYAKILELMPYIQDDIATTISVAQIIVDYMSLSENILLPPKIDSLILQHVLQWQNSDNLDIRWNATRIMFMLLRNSKNESIINNQILNIVDNDNVYIKNLIMQNIYKFKGITKKTREYVISKLENDDNYVVRLICREVQQECKINH
ncbi:MAG: hypothetical protein NC300_11135 [Bacteroidales bacterium]|nr:hypothetical protein [Clostridium sp.]MCM1204684.1 hypothetical protein [Bacteroidales bacterium]